MRYPDGGVCKRNVPFLDWRRKVPSWQRPLDGHYPKLCHYWRHLGHLGPSGVRLDEWARVVGRCLWDLDSADQGDEGRPLRGFVLPQGLDRRPDWCHPGRGRGLSDRWSRVRVPAGCEAFEEEDEEEETLGEALQERLCLNREAAMEQRNYWAQVSSLAAAAATAAAAAAAVTAADAAVECCCEFAEKWEEADESGHQDGDPEEEEKEVPLSTLPHHVRLPLTLKQA